ncbi:MAG: peroxiredoxin [Chloroflexales bacterium]|nr:peroxiredoxin [Chloroflexales bacterium]
MIQIQHIAPLFTAEAALPDGAIGEINLGDYRGQYVVLFFYPLDFTFVCPTEIYAFADRIDDFQQRNCAVLGVSVDSVYAHLAWLRVGRNEGGIAGTPYPLIADLDKQIARDYGVLLDKPAVALRALFLIDRSGIVRSAMVNDLTLGRNLDEVIRLLDALQSSEQSGNVCPANWRRGEPMLEASLEGVRAYAREHAAFP